MRINYSRSHHHYRYRHCTISLTNYHHHRNNNAIPNYGIVGRFHTIHDAVQSFPSSTATRFSHEQRHMMAMTDSFQLLMADATTTTTVPAATAMIMTDNDNNIGMLSKEATIIVFIIGIIPFVIATYEFWRRIAVGATFGTGNDSVIFPTTTIGEDNAPSSSRGKQILGTDSLITAYIIFATVAVVLGIVFYSVVTSPIPTSM